MNPTTEIGLMHCDERVSFFGLHGARGFVLGGIVLLRSKSVLTIIMHAPLAVLIYVYFNYYVPTCC